MAFDWREFTASHLHAGVLNLGEIWSNRHAVEYGWRCGLYGFRAAAVAIYAIGNWDSATPKRFMPPAASEVNYWEPVLASIWSLQLLKWVGYKIEVCSFTPFVLVLCRIISFNCSCWSGSG